MAGQSWTHHNIGRLIIFGGGKFYPTFVFGSDRRAYRFYDSFFNKETFEGGGHVYIDPGTVVDSGSWTDYIKHAAHWSWSQQDRVYLEIKTGSPESDTGFIQRITVFINFPEEFDEEGELIPPPVDIKAWCLRDERYLTGLFWEEKTNLIVKMWDLDGLVSGGLATITYAAPDGSVTIDPDDYGRDFFPPLGDGFLFRKDRVSEFGSLGDSILTVGIRYPETEAGIPILKFNAGVTAYTTNRPVDLPANHRVASWCYPDLNGFVYQNEEREYVLNDEDNLQLVTIFGSSIFSERVTVRLIGLYDTGSGFDVVESAPINIIEWSPELIDASRFVTMHYASLIHNVQVFSEYTGEVRTATAAKLYISIAGVRHELASYAISLTNFFSATHTSVHAGGTWRAAAHNEKTLIISASVDTFTGAGSTRYKDFVIFYNIVTGDFTYDNTPTMFEAVNGGLATGLF